MTPAIDRRVLDRLTARQRSLWLAALALYGVGDLVTTAVGLTTGRGGEAGPLVAAAVSRFGLAGLLAAKVAVLVGFYLLWRAADTPGRVAVPLALAVAGGGVTLWNCYVLVV